MKRVLVANRGEIAVRIMTTLQRLGIECVAVYSEVDHAAPHVSMADAAVCIGRAAPAESYLQIEQVIKAARDTLSDAIHPGYGLLSESVEFAQRCEAAGLIFIGPTAEQIGRFGKKHTARDLARSAGVALVPGSDVLESAEGAVQAAEITGYPVILKASAGGGGIGMKRCNNASELVEAFTVVRHLAENNFGDATVFVERFVENARHIEVQVFGDGTGRVVTLGERDCSAQRRNQKVIEETPACGINDRLRQRLLDDARRLASSVNYRSAGTVEFVVDADSIHRPDGGDAWFLEVNTRLQVEHGVTELTHDIDLVEWMVRLAAGDLPDVFSEPPAASGAALQVRLYAEDPLDDFAPSPGLITEFSAPDTVRCDTWVSAGTTVSTFYDPLLAKLLVHAPDRASAIDAMVGALRQTSIGGIASNRELLIDTLDSATFRSGETTTSSIEALQRQPDSIKVIEGGLFTTIQDLPGRLGYWQVGIPPSGPMDDVSFRLVNRLLGNAAETAALEITLAGPTLRFRRPTLFAFGGATIPAQLNGQALAPWTVHKAEAGSTLEMGTIPGPGARTILAVAGGFVVPQHLGSTSTFVLGGFGGHSGRTLRPGDVLSIGTAVAEAEPGAQVPAEEQPMLTETWEIEVLPGPHAAPDYFTRKDIEMLYAAEWRVHFNSDRTGIRLVGPTPEWARADGGEAGLHPSNIHDNAYSIGAIDFTGDMPIILGRDGPSLGGFVCPATIAENEFWKIGQARAGDTVRFVSRLPSQPDPVLLNVKATTDQPQLMVRRAGDRHLLIEYGENVLDLLLRLRIGALMDKLASLPDTPFTELVPGIRSLQVRCDPSRWTTEQAVELIAQADRQLPDIRHLDVPSRIVRLPLSWDDPTTQQAAQKYMETVRADAPWCPWNIEFIRRINGLSSVDEVRRIVFEANYLVMGLGDVYLGAPVATPLDPRHRLVTTKYNPARTWTAENSVGIGGAYLCIYGMEGPGGYQLVGRTLPVWDRWGRNSANGFEKPWLLRFFDQIQWYHVTAEELLDLRADVEAGRYKFEIEDASFSVPDYLAMLEHEKASITEFEARRTSAFESERQRWEAAGLTLEPSEELTPRHSPASVLEPGQASARSPIPGVIWKTCVKPGDRVEAGSAVVIIESMKMETLVPAPISGTVASLLCAKGDTAEAGQALAVISP